MPATLPQAIAAARGTDEKNEWLNLEPSQQTSAIYREMRRIDLEEATLVQHTKDAPATKAASAERHTKPQPRCCAMLKYRKKDQCSWSAIVKRRGSWYCGLHDPRSPARASRKNKATQTDPEDDLSISSC